MIYMIRLIFMKKVLTMIYMIRLIFMKKVLTMFNEIKMIFMKKVLTMINKIKMIFMKKESDLPLTKNKIIVITKIKQITVQTMTAAYCKELGIDTPF